MKRTVMIFALMGLTVITLFGANQALLLARPPATAAETMEIANNLYERGQFGLAAQAYQQLADQGFADSILYFNLGNAFFKQGDYGRAILNYRRAERLAPRDEDIAANLALARAQRVDQIKENSQETEPIRQEFISRLGQSTQPWLTLNELALSALGFWFLLVVLAILFSNTRRSSRWREALQYGLIGTALVLMIGIAGLGSRLYAEHNDVEGVIVAGQIDVVSGPGAQYVTEFSLHSGAEVELIEQRETWTRLAIPGSELQGWVPAKAVAAIDG